MRLRTLAVLLLVNTGAGTALGAQSRANAYVDFTLGTNALITRIPINGQYYEGGHGFGFLAFGNQPDANRPLVAALHLGLFAVLGDDAMCDVTPLGGCYRDFPFGSLIAITVGSRPVNSPWRVLELTAGPALLGVLESEPSFGGLAVGRIGFPPGRYLSPGIAVHILAAPVDGALVFATGLGFSLRTW